MSLLEEITNIPQLFCDDVVPFGDEARSAEVVSINKTLSRRKDIRDKVKSNALHHHSDIPMILTNIGSVVRVIPRRFCNHSFASKHIVTDLASAMPDHKNQFDCNNSKHPLSQESMAAFWTRRGFPYDIQKAAFIPQVKVQFRTWKRNNVDHTSETECMELTYPADKVFRRKANVRIANVERKLFQCQASVLDQSSEQQSTGDSTAVSADKSPSLTTNASWKETWGSQKVTMKIRNFFIAPKNCVLLSVDFAQIELRLLAHFSGDKILLRAFAEKMDIFRVMAAHITALGPKNKSSIHNDGLDSAPNISDVPLVNWNTMDEKALAAVSKEQRALAKAICYSIVYGSGIAVRWRDYKSPTTFI